MCLETIVEVRCGQLTPFLLTYYFQIPRYTTVLYYTTDSMVEMPD